MPESTIADFPARMNLADESETALTEARVMMSRERIVVSAEDTLVTAPITRISDLAVGNAPPDLDIGEQRPVSIAYDRDGTTKVVTIAANPDHVDRFVELLFRLLLDGTQVRVASSATDEEVAAVVSVEDGAVHLQTEDGPDIDLVATHVDALAISKQFAGSADPRARIEAPSGPGPDEVVVRIPSTRQMNFFGRYLGYWTDVSPDEEPVDRILLVDDDPTMIDVLETFILRERDDVEITGVTSAADGLRILENGPEINAIVSDYHMPRMDGIEFLKAVREDYPNLPFILFTGKGNESVIKAAIKAGVTDYVEKRLGSGQHVELVEHIDQAMHPTGARVGG